MDLGCIGFTLEMCILESGVMGRVMGVEHILVMMGVYMLANLNGGSNMVLATITLGKSRFSL